MTEDTLLFRIGELERVVEKIRDRLHHHAEMIQPVPDHARRIRELEARDFAVLSTRVEYLEERVDAMAKALWTAAGALVIAAVTFALAVASGQL